MVSSAERVGLIARSASDKWPQISLLTLMVATLTFCVKSGRVKVTCWSKAFNAVQSSPGSATSDSESGECAAAEDSLFCRATAMASASAPPRVCRGVVAYLDRAAALESPPGSTPSGRSSDKPRAVVPRPVRRARVRHKRIATIRPVRGPAVRQVPAPRGPAQEQQQRRRQQSRRSRRSRRPRPAAPHEMDKTGTVSFSSFSSFSSRNFRRYTSTRYPVIPGYCLPAASQFCVYYTIYPIKANIYKLHILLMLIWGTMAPRTRELVRNRSCPIGAVRHYAYIHSCSIEYTIYKLHIVPMLIWGTMAYARTRELVHGIDHVPVRHYAYIAGSPHPVPSAQIIRYA